LTGGVAMVIATADTALFYCILGFIPSPTAKYRGEKK